MAVLQSSRSRTATVSGAPFATVFARLGPFSSGTWLESLIFDMTSDAAISTSFGAVITTSSASSGAAFGTGQSILTRAFANSGGVPAHLLVTLVTGHNGPYEWPIGIRLSGGSQFVLCRMAIGLGTLVGSFNVSVRSVELL